MGNSLISIKLNLIATLKLIYTASFTYSTVRSANINNKCVAIIYRLVQLGILTYIIGFNIIWNKGYQDTDIAISTVTTKVKGLGYVINSLESDNTCNNERDHIDSLARAIFERVNLSNYSEADLIRRIRLFDTADYVVPSNEYNSIFVMTNFIETKQTLDSCDESPKKAKCKSNKDCNALHFINTWSGVPTGNCINSTFLNNTKVCEIVGWCPIENDYFNEDKNVINSTLSYTIFIKNDIEFNKFNRKERNILPNMTNSYISNCKNDGIKDPHCPVFTVEGILQNAEPDEKERQQMLKKGGIIQIGINWNCNYDFYNSRCVPEYTFKRYDVPFRNTSTASGFNFRFANKYVVDGRAYRTLYKAYGLRFFISVNGQAGKFSFLPLMITIGTGFGLMSISVLIADCVLLNFTNKKTLFKKLKELDIQNNNTTYTTTRSEVFLTERL